MNVFLHELKAYRKSTIIWTIAICMVAIMFLSLFPAFASDAQGLRELLKNYPEALIKALGISVEEISSFLGFYSFLLTYILLTGAVQAMNFGLSVISKETREKTADFLLTKPITRKKIVVSKILAVFASLLITNTVFLIVAMIMSQAVKTETFSIGIFVMLSLTLLFVQLMFMAMGVIVSVILPKVKSVISISLGTVFGFFILSMFGSVIGEKAVRYLTPFKYFDTSYIIKNSGYEFIFAAIEVLFIALALVTGCMVYSRKDIHAV